MLRPPTTSEAYTLLNFYYLLLKIGYWGLFGLLALIVASITKDRSSIEIEATLIIIALLLP